MSTYTGEHRFYHKLVQDITQEIGEFFADPKVTQRSLTLADTVCYEIWGGSRGWEGATDEQFDSLVKRLKEKLRSGTTQKEAKRSEEASEASLKEAQAEEEEARLPWRGWREDRRPHSNG